MAKYQVTFSCGHIEEMQLFGKVKDRERKIEYWERNGLCSECYRKQQLEAATKKAGEMGLPELQGTEKQVAWAQKIRFTMIGAIQDTINMERFAKGFNAKIAELGRDGFIAEIEKTIKDENQKKSAIERFKKYCYNIDRLAAVKTETSAKWFIDNRF